MPVVALSLKTHYSEDIFLILVISIYMTGKLQTQLICPRMLSTTNFQIFRDKQNHYFVKLKTKTYETLKMDRERKPLTLAYIDSCGKF